MFKKMMIVVNILLLLGTAMFGEAVEKNVAVNLVDSNDPGKWSGMVKINRDVFRSGDFSFELSGKYPTEITWKDYIPVSPEKLYNLSASFRSLSKDKPASAFLGLRYYDKDKRMIGLGNVWNIEDTQSELTADAKRGDSVLYVKNNPAILNKAKKNIVAFGVEDDFSDLPNFSISPPIENAREEAGVLKITLKSPLKKDYAAGLKIRLHTPFVGVPFFWAARGWMPADSWKTFSQGILGQARSGPQCFLTDQIWPGAKYARVFCWFGNYNRIPEKGAKLVVDDITFTEAPKPDLTISVPYISNGKGLDIPPLGNAWRQARKLGLVQLGKQSNIQKSCAQIICDKNFLYIALTAFEKSPATIKKRTTIKTGDDLWNDDCFEVMLGAAKDRDGYYQIIVNSLGVYRVLSREVNSGNLKDAPDFKMKTQAMTFHDRWELILKIPLARFSVRGFQHPWIFNIFRTRPESKNRTGAESSGISMLSGNYHNPNAYCRLLWPEEIKEKGN